MKKSTVAKPATTSDLTSDPSTLSRPCYRIGDLLWCQELRNNKLWWPAMVTYDPNLGIFYRTTKLKTQYHVQYFGISATRGWTVKSCVPFSDAAERAFDVKGLPKKVRAEYEVAMQEVNEAKTLSYKQRKLKFIFSFGPPRKGGKKKVSSSIAEPSRVSPTEVEAKEGEIIKSVKEAQGEGSMSVKEEVKHEQAAVSSSRRRKSKRISMSSRGSSPDLAPASKHPCSIPQLQLSSKIKEPSLSLSSSHDACDEKVAVTDKELLLQTQSAQDTTSLDGKKKESIEISSPPTCLHNQHSKRKLSGMSDDKQESIEMSSPFHETEDSFNGAGQGHLVICLHDQHSKRMLSGISDGKQESIEISSPPTCIHDQHSKSMLSGMSDGKQKESIEISSPPTCLHDQHSKKKLSGMRRSSSDSSFRECEQCMDYICGLESQQLKCTSEPEKLKPLDMEASSKPIVMYVQKEYSSDKKEAKPSALQSKVAASTSSHVPLIKSVPKSMVPEISSSAQESSKPEPFAHRSDAASRASGQPRSIRKASALCSASLKLLCSPTGSLHSESGYEKGRSGQPLSASGLRSGKKESVGDISSSSQVASSLLHVQSKKLPETESEKEPVRRSKRSRASSLSVSCSESIMDKPLAEEFGLPTAKRTHQSSRRHSEQSTSSMSFLARSSRVKDLATFDSINSPAESAGNSANDSCSEASLTPVVLTPTAASPAESSSVGVDSSVASAVGSSSSVSNTKLKKKVKHNFQPAGNVNNTCSICECEDADLLMCQGYCASLFHLDCLGLVEKPSFDFVCDECLISSGTCFVCGKAYGEIKQCSKSKCTKLYHPKCIKNNKLFQCEKNSSFICPLHVCAKCTSISGLSSCSIQSKNLVQCVKCPLALHQPDCLVAGCETLDQTHMICYQHVKISRNSRLYSHINLNTCLECGSIGSLYCCDVCSAAYHLECLDEVSRPASESSFWKCPSCTVHDLPTYKSLVITKFGKWRWWPSEIVSPEDIPDNILVKKPGDCMFVVRFCGSREFCWTYHGRAIPYAEETEVVEGIRPPKKIKALDKYQTACEEARTIFKEKQVELEARQAVLRQNSNLYYKIKTNKYLVPRPHSDPEHLDSIPCQCTPENPCRESSTCVNRASHVECTPKSCPVGGLCQNQRIQKFQNAKTETFYTGNRGWGLKASTDLSIGDFVIEYVGEVLDEAMCRERIKKAQETNCQNFYMLTLDGRLIIDAGYKSNHARFINHSCNPNCETQKWRVRGEVRIGIIVREMITAGTELTFDYHLDSLGNDKKQCNCGSKNCSGFLGLPSIKVVPEEERKVKMKVKKKKAKPKPRPPVKEEEAVEDLHDDLCFVCRDGGELLLCDHKSCIKVYHLSCIGLKAFPPTSQKWECPLHYCDNCQKPSVATCSTCTHSYCSKHEKDELIGQPKIKCEGGKDAGEMLPGSSKAVQDQLLCQRCLKSKDDQTMSGSEQMDTSEAAPINSKTTVSHKKSVSKAASTIKNSEQSVVVKAKKRTSRVKNEHQSSPADIEEVVKPMSRDSCVDSPQKPKIEKEEEPELQPVPFPVIQSGNQPSIKKNKLKELLHNNSGSSSSQFSPVQVENSQLHKSPVNSHVAPPAPSASACLDEIIEPLDVEDKTTFATTILTSSAAATSVARTLSPEPNVDVVYSPPPHPPMSGGLGVEEHSEGGLEDLLQQHPSLPPPQQMKPNSYLPRGTDPHISPGGFRPGGINSSNSLNKTLTPPLFQQAQQSVGCTSSHIQSPTLAGGSQGYPSPMLEPAHQTIATKYPSGFMDIGTGLMRASTGFQQQQQAPPFNSLWFMNRNGIMNGLDQGTSGFGYHTPYPPMTATFISHNPLAIPYPTYFPDPNMPNFEAFTGNFGTHHHQVPPSSAASTSTSTAPTSTGFPTVFPPGHPQNSFLAWK